MVVSIDLETNRKHRPVRKFSVETVIGGTEERFCLRGESNQKNEPSKTFMTSLKMFNIMTSDGIKHPQADMLSPSMSSRTLFSQPDEDNIVESSLDKDTIPNKFDLTEDKILEMDIDIQRLPGIEDQEVEELEEWKQSVIFGKKCKEDVLSLMDEYQDKSFKKN